MDKQFVTILLCLAVASIVNCKTCPDGSPVISCQGDPCRHAVCDKFPEADCVVNFCGNTFCLAEFFVQGARVAC